MNNPTSKATVSEAHMVLNGPAHRHQLGWLTLLLRQPGVRSDPTSEMEMIWPASRG